MTQKTKAQIATEVYAALQAAGTLTRKAFIEEMTTKHGMTPAGASTYYVNSKARAEGKEVKSYYKSKKSTTNSVDTGDEKNAAEDTDLTSIVVLNSENNVEAVHSFMTELTATERFAGMRPETQARCAVVRGAPAVGVSLDTLQRVSN